MSYFSVKSLACERSVLGVFSSECIKYDKHERRLLQQCTCCGSLLFPLIGIAWHMTVVGKGGKRRTVLLDDPRLVQQLRTYLKRMGYQHGPLFRAEKNGRGGPLRYQSMQERWDSYCSQAGVACTLHQLRHAHATELINGGVSLSTIRKRLGHTNLQTTLRYAEQSDQAADAEVRVWRRKQQ